MTNMSFQYSTEVTRRTLIKGAAVGTFALAGAGILAACENGTNAGNEANGGGEAAGSTGSGSTVSGSTGSGSTGSGSTGSGSTADGAAMLDPKAAIDYTKAGNFDVLPESKTTVGSTQENLIAAISGETAATTKYAAYAAVAESAGFSEIARLFQATSDAEKIHIELEFAALKKIDPQATKPLPPSVETHATDSNLIFGATGEIYETSDMYPAFIKAATAAGDSDVAAIFARAKLAESVHAERYLDAYNKIDTPDNDVYYLCPVCGYIHKGENFTACPICLTKKEQFRTY